MNQAELGLSYTRVYASESGYVTKKSVEPGNLVQARAGRDGHRLGPAVGSGQLQGDAA